MTASVVAATRNQSTWGNDTIMYIDCAYTKRSTLYHYKWKSKRREKKETKTHKMCWLFISVPRSKWGKWMSQSHLFVECIFQLNAFDFRFFGFALFFFALSVLYHFIFIFVVAKLYFVLLAFDFFLLCNNNNASRVCSVIACAFKPPRRSNQFDMFLAGNMQEETRSENVIA